MRAIDIFVLVALSAGLACESGRDHDPEDSDDDLDDTAVPDDTATECDTGKPEPEEMVRAGSYSGDLDAERAVFDEGRPPREGNPSRVQYLARTIPDEELDDIRPEVVTPLDLRIPDPAATVVPWNSPAGILESYEIMFSDVPNDFERDEQVCIEPTVVIECCTYVLNEGDETDPEITYYSTEDAYITEESAENALFQISAELPLFVPFDASEVTLGHGWMYNGKEKRAHGSIDYRRSETEAGVDVSFVVRASSWGTVVAKFWDPWHGNVLILEHPGPGDLTYRTLYFHLRNGGANDREHALNDTDATGDPDASEDKYLEFAANYTDALYWGTDDHEIRVDVGDPVSAGEPIAWSGNTGPGGAGAGLNADGSPKNTTTANNHLHFMAAVKHPTLTGGEWVFVDPYGVYDQQESGCYDLLQVTRFDRLLAPYFPAFHNVPVNVVNFYLGYYARMGLQLRTLTVARNEGDVLAAGIFESGFTGGWLVYDYMRGDDFQDVFDDAWAKGFRPREIGVTLDSNEDPRYTAIFQENEPGQGMITLMDASDATFADIWDQWVVDKGWHVLDFVGYDDHGTARQAVLLVDDGESFALYPHYSSAAITDTLNDVALDGLLPVSFTAGERPGGTSFSSVVEFDSGGRMVHWSMSATDYQEWFDFYGSIGWQLLKVQNYDEGDAFAAIWTE